MSKHHPATKTALWRATVSALKGSPSYVRIHAQKLIKSLYEGGADCSRQSLIARNVSNSRLVDTNPCWMLHKYICNHNGWPLLTWGYK